MAKIDYTGADGKRHAFDADTSDAVFGSLSKISGYLNPKADELTRGLGEGLRAKRAKRSAEFAKGLNLGEPYGQRKGYGADGDGVRTVSVVTGVRIGKDGELVAEVASLALPDTVRVVGRNEVTIGKVTAEKEKSKTSAPVAAADGETMEVVTGSDYDADTHKFKNKVALVTGMTVLSRYDRVVFEAVQETVAASA